VGPTASGKSDLALRLAESLDGEIVNYDSIQLYRMFDIGTAKSPPADRRGVPHHLIDVLDPDEISNAGDYQRLARGVLDDIRGRRRLPILVGGTGLYLRAVIDGLFDGPQRSEYWRSRLTGISGLRGPEYLHRVLGRLDREAAAKIAPRDVPKVVRALEIRLSTGRSMSGHLSEAPRDPIRGYAFSNVGLDPPRRDLYARIALRVRRMFAEGLVAEVRSILDRGVSTDAAAFRAIGYRQALQYLDGIMSLDEAIMRTERDTRRYAKRQRTWFRRQHAPDWFAGFGGDPEVQEGVERLVGDRIVR
jgi:tRNA dimethylallyltransferase